VTSALGGGKPGRNKRKALKRNAKKAAEE